MFVCGVPCSIYGAGDDIVCVRQSDGTAFPLKQTEAHLLLRMSTLKTVGDWIETLHKDAILERLLSGKHSFLKQLLRWASSSTSDAMKEGKTKLYSNLPYYKRFSRDIDSLMERGLVATVEQSLQAIMAASDPSAESCRITTLCIPTCGRAEYLSRCVSSFSDRLHAHGRNDATILVVDDSADRASEMKNRAIVTSLQAGEGPPISFVGYEERQSLIHALLRKSVAPPEVIQFALNAEKLLTTEGSARNTMLLLTGGQSILQTDDDTYCAYVSANARNRNVIVSSVLDPYQTYFFPDRRSNLAEFPVSPDIDPFAIHEAVLGKSLSNVLSNAISVSWDEANPQRFTNASGGGGQIDITTTGASGDPGKNSCLGLVTLAPVDTLRRAYSSPHSYKLATESRELLRLVPELTICRHATFQAMSFGINNKRLQPPFFPLGHNVDGAFSLLYTLSGNRSLIGHIPFAISHQSEANRHYMEWPTDTSDRLQLTDVLMMCLASVRQAPDAGMAQNLRSIGEQIVTLASTSRTTFKYLVCTLYVQSRLSMGKMWEDLIEANHLGSKQLIHNLTSLSRSSRLSLLNELNIIPRDLASTSNPDGALAKCQDLILMYGKLMLHWENIVAAAYEINQLSGFVKPFRHSVQ
jgi:hypothetical protein